MLEKAWLFRNQLNPVAELDGAGNLMARFVYGSRSNVPEYVVRGGVTYRILSDHLGSPRALVDVATGTVAWRADFDAWGNRALIAGAADFLPFGFAGGMLDAETGLTRFGARDYDPVVGRWTSKDPIAFAARDKNFYRYSDGDPINRRDASGTGKKEDCEDECTEKLEPTLNKCVDACWDEHFQKLPICNQSGSAPDQQGAWQDYQKCVGDCQNKFTDAWSQCHDSCIGSP
ncbi:MAG: RHS repeat-associated core domain-containing protein [Myxococcales bacterium]|nr:RHS repeat-associated core domain-containing protein [Myxococcales bacterium]